MGTRYRGSESEKRALNAFITLMRAADTVSGVAHRHLSDHGLTASQFGALEALYHCGDLCQGDLAAKVLRSFGSVTSVLDGLEKRGLAERRRGAEDKRFVNVRLTAAGKRLVEGVLPSHVKAIAERFSVLSSVQQEELRAICRKLGKG